MTHQPVVRLETMDVLHLLLLSPHLDQCDLGKQGQHHRRGWDGGQAFVPWELLGMGAEGETDLTLDHAGDHQAQHGQDPRAAIRSGFSSQTGAIAAGFWSQRKPGSTVVFCS
jgi:hypothetical protein